MTHKLRIPHRPASQEATQPFTDGYEVIWPSFFVNMSVALPIAVLVGFNLFQRILTSHHPSGAAHAPSDAITPVAIIGASALAISGLILQVQWAIVERHRRTLEKYIDETPDLAAFFFNSDRHFEIVDHLKELSKRTSNPPGPKVDKRLTISYDMRDKLISQILRQHLQQRAALSEGSISVLMEQSPWVVGLLASQFSRMDAVSHRDIDYWADMATGHRYFQALLDARAKNPNFRMNRIFVVNTDDIDNDARLEKLAAVLAEHHFHNIGFGVAFEDLFDQETHFAADYHDSRIDSCLWDHDKAVSFFRLTIPKKFQTFFNSTDMNTIGAKRVRGQRMIYPYLIYETMVCNKRFRENLKDALKEEEKNIIVHICKRVFGDSVTTWLEAEAALFKRTFDDTSLTSEADMRPAIKELLTTVRNSLPEGDPG